MRTAMLNWMYFETQTSEDSPAHHFLGHSVYASFCHALCTRCRYADTYVRNKAVDQLNQLPPDDLYDLLPQLVQVSLSQCCFPAVAIVSAATLYTTLLGKKTAPFYFCHKFVIKSLFSYTYVKNYWKRSLFEKVRAKIKRCSFFAPQCRLVTCGLSAKDRDQLQNPSAWHTSMHCLYFFYWNL